MFEKSKKVKKTKTVSNSTKSKSLEPKSRFNFSMAPSVKLKVDAAAKEMGISASAFITMCVSNYFMQQESVKLVEEFKDLLKLYSDHVES